MDERRRSSRLKSFIKGTLRFENGRSCVDCLVRDLSDDGARLKLSAIVPTPDVLDLHMPSKDETRRIRIRWRRADELGVEFVDRRHDDADTAAPTDLEGRVAHLEKEVAALRRALADVRALVKDRHGES